MQSEFYCFLVKEFLNASPKSIGVLDLTPLAFNKKGTGIICSNLHQSLMLHSFSGHELMLRVYSL